MENRIKKCLDCPTMITKKATRCLDCNAIHMKSKTPINAIKSNQKIDRNIKPYMLVRNTSDKPSTRMGASCMIGGSI